MDSYVSSHLQKYYKNPEKAKRDVQNLLQHYRGLQPKVETFVFNDGASKQLLCLGGTIPVHYKGSDYNIPVALWLLETHPVNAPMVFVRPTSDMRLRISKHVDHNGKVYMPYLHVWSPNESDLVALVQVMIIIFGEQPPVYSVAGQPPSNPAAAYPGSLAGYPPYPTSATAYPPATPYPPYPPVNGPASTSYPSYSGGYPPYPPAPGTITSSAAYPPYPTPAGVPNAQSTGTISEDHIRASLLSAVEDKVRRRLSEIFAQAQAEIETLKKTENELRMGQSKLEDLGRRLDQEQNEVERSIASLKERNSELEDSLGKLKSQDKNFDVDEAVVTTAPIYKQLLNAYAEEAATEDAIYYLGEGLRRGVIELDVFLKNVRSLSRKQFMLRALMERCRQQAGLTI
ncbi:tumor susceptibility gene 101 protein-like [Daphnia pulex]|uniref:tumor susceptibility gene 101 protein-like n=1 Tax=Daphnia pulex TaxID=6669 RepID=UPI001EDFAA5C|nr:tumor susceptibility gene 101 protein-like [Daphnia pulex]